MHESPGQDDVEEFERSAKQTKSSTGQKTREVLARILSLRFCNSHSWRVVIKPGGFSDSDISLSVRAVSRSPKLPRSRTLKVTYGSYLEDLSNLDQNLSDEPEIVEAMRCGRMNNRCKQRLYRIESATLSRIALTHRLLGSVR